MREGGVPPPARSAEAKLHLDLVNFKTILLLCMYTNTDTEKNIYIFRL